MRDIAEDGCRLGELEILDVATDFLTTLAAYRKEVLNG
jgi:hypothetical protein